MATAATGAPGAPSLTRLTYDVLDHLDRLGSGRPVDGDAQMGVALAIAGRGTAEERYVRSLSDPASPDYHRFLAPAEVGRRFGPAPAVTAAVTRWLRDRHLAVDQVGAAGDFVAAHGTAAAVQAAFDVTERTYSVAGTDVVANDRGPRVPAGVYSVLGLNTSEHFARAARGSLRDDGVSTGALTPAQISSVYELPPDWRGQGQSVGIIGEGDTSKITPNLRAFEKHFGLPQPRVEIHCVEQRTCGTDTTGDVEWAIDTQSSTAMAPGLSALHLYFSRDLSDQSLDRAFVAWISDPNGPRQASASEGVCEQTPLNGLFTGPLDAVNINSHPSLPVGLALGDLQEPVLDQQLRHAVAEGRTLFASTGDLGFTCGLLYVTGIGEGNGVLYNGLPLVLYPAASPYAVAVGGTVLHTVGSPARRFSEDGWNFGGGGTSHYEPAPAYQVGTPNVTGTCASTPDGGREGAGIPCRGIPDVAAISGDITGNGFAAVVGDHVTSVGGTSLSSPLWAGMWARIQSAAASPVGNGFANPLLYRVGRDPAAAAVGFHDITTGSNPYPAKPGWDYITGFGVPRVRGLVRLIDKR